MKPEEAIKGLAEEARRIGHQHADQASAWERTLEAKAELLQAIIDAVKPALQAICSRVVLKKETPGGERADVVATWTGIRIAGGLGDARALYLTVGGVLMEVDYIWGGGWEWQGKWCPQTVRHTITEFDIEPMIESLTQALVAQAKGGAQKRTELLQVHAVQLQAVATLLRGIR